MVLVHGKRKKKKWNWFTGCAVNVYVQLPVEHWEEQAALFALSFTAELLSACSHVIAFVCMGARARVYVFCR